MRVIAGTYKSRSLRALPGIKTRPTSDRLRETLFNVVTAGDPGALEGSAWLDLFAGTGAVGIEALSRGARHVTFVDSQKNATRVIQDNLKSLGIRAGFDILEHDVLRALRLLEGHGFTADYVFIDPPYADSKAYEETFTLLSQSQLLGQDALIIVEHDKRFDPTEAFGELQRYRKLVQGDSGLSLYRKR
jgi:16S rRNA (guanine966-N2)-methyltransferase